jgi:hypothetical protein
MKARSSMKPDARLRSGPARSVTRMAGRLSVATVAALIAAGAGRANEAGPCGPVRTVTVPVPLGRAGDLDRRNGPRLKTYWTALVLFGWFTDY